MQTKLKFTVDSALLRELGEKLVETVHLALSELVKNAYDADATEVEVIFDKNKEGQDRIQIIDNGVGMNFEAVENYWMRIATTNKAEEDKKEKRSPVFGRPYTGAKGIGRFSCRRLGSKLTLITKGTKSGKKLGEQNDIQQSIVIFPWTDFEAGTEVTTIECPGEQDTLLIGYTGTTLIIENISDEWNRRGMNWLQRQLAILTANRGVHRKGYEEDTGFDVMLTAPNVESGIVDIREKLINAGWGTLTAKINENHQAECILETEELGTRKITSDMRFPNLNDVSLEVGIMVHDREQIRDFSVISKTSLDEILSDWGGVQVQYRGFRVYPYGSDGDDWLNIEKDKARRLASPRGELLAFADSLRGVEPSRSLLNMLAMKNYIGSVKIGPKAKGFDMKASREGFVETEEFLQLKQFVRFAIDWSTILRDFNMRQETAKKADKAKHELEEALGIELKKSEIVKAAVHQITTTFEKVISQLGKKEKEQVEQDIERATNVIQTQNQTLLVELSHLRLIASTNTLLLVFSHEVKSLLALLEQSKNSLLNISRKIAHPFKEDLIKIGDNFKDLNDRLGELLQLTSLVSNRKVNNKPTRVAVKPRVIKVQKIFELITSKYEIEIDSAEVSNTVVVKDILEAEVYSILINVLSNSIKAVIAAGNERKIKISADSYIGKTQINIYDNGIGLEKSNYNNVFIPFISDPEGKLYYNLEKKLNPEDSAFVGSGSGLGLGIVREIVAANGGNIRFVDPPNGWSTALEITL